MLFLLGRPLTCFLSSLSVASHVVQLPWDNCLLLSCMVEYIAVLPYPCPFVLLPAALHITVCWLRDSDGEGSGGLCCTVATGHLWPCRLTCWPAV